MPHGTLQSPLGVPGLHLVVGMLPHMGTRVQGERTAHRHLVLHRDLGRKGGLKKCKHLMISVGFGGQWS